MRNLARAEDAHLDIDSGKSRFHAGHGVLDVPGNLFRARPGKFLDDKHEARFAVDQRIADHRRMAFDHLGHVTDHPRRVVVERKAHHVGRRQDREHVLDPEPLVRRVDETAGTGGRSLEVGQCRHPERVAGSFDDLLQPYLALRQNVRVGDHLHLPLALAPDRHVGNALHTGQPGNDGPAGQHRHVDEGECIRCQTDLRDPRLGADRLPHDRWLRHVGQRMRRGQPFLHHLARDHEVGTRLENQLDGGKPGDRTGFHPVQPRDAVQHVGLERHGDHRLDFLGRQPKRLGLHFDHGRPEVRQDVDRHSQQGRPTSNDGHNAEHYDGQTVPYCSFENI